MPTVLTQAADAVGSIFGRRTEEQPKYTVIERFGGVEVREYAPRLAAETTVTGKADAAARGEAFRRLAGYIFGRNRAKQSIAMTAPVTNEQTASQKIAMTAPVENNVRENGLTMRFFLPSALTSDTAPVPLDDAVKIVPIDRETIAVVSYSGSWSMENQKRHEQALLSVLKNAKWRPIGEPFAQLYDPPFTLPWLRLNETAVRVSRV